MRIILKSGDEIIATLVKEVDDNILYAIDGMYGEVKKEEVVYIKMI